MATEKQIEANRLNAQRSTGPKTADGKEKTRMNGLSHGLRAHRVDVMPHESREEFDARIEAFYLAYQPRNEAEDNLVRQAAILSWKIDRADRYEHVALSMRVLDAVEATKGKATIEIERAMDLATFDASNEGERIRRYQFTLQRAFLRVLDTLERMRAKDSRREGSPLIQAGQASPSVTGPQAPPRPVSAPVAAPSEANFDQILGSSRPSNSTTEPNSPRAVQPKFAGVTKRAVEALDFIRAIEANPAGTLDVSCLKS